MGCSFFKFRLTIRHTYSHFRIQALHIHTLALESNCTAVHSSDQNSSSAGPESYKAVLTVSTDVVLAKWSATTFASWGQWNWRGSPRSSCPLSCPADARLTSKQWRPLLVRIGCSPRCWRPLDTSLQPRTLSRLGEKQGFSGTGSEPSVDISVRNAVVLEMPK